MTRSPTGSDRASSECSEALVAPAGTPARVCFCQATAEGGVALPIAAINQPRQGMQPYRTVCW
jgi:hypothetical protein